MRISGAPAVLALCVPFALAAQTETLTYDVEWRLIHAGTVRLTSEGPRARLVLQSGGLVSKLYRVNDQYSVNFEDQFCAAASVLEAQEGKRHRETRITFDRFRNRAVYLERDVIKNLVVRTEEIDVPHCVHDIVGALERLRRMRIEPGKSAQLPMSDGKKSVLVRVEAQERESVKTKLGQFPAVRYEAFLFDGALYTRKARAHVWLTDDERRLPVQIRLRMQFTIGTITLQLSKEERS